MSSGETALIARSAPPSTSGVGTKLHSSPSKCSSTVSPLPVYSARGLALPSAHTSLGEIASTAISWWSSSSPANTPSASVQVSPSKCSSSGCFQELCASLTLLSPTAQASPGLSALTASSVLRVGSPLTGAARLQLVPFQCAIRPPVGEPESPPTAHTSSGPVP